MAHIHCVYDNDTYFKIDAATKTIKNEGSTLVLVQGNHNSERFTFEMPRYIDGHDMSLCNRTEIHYLNIDGRTGEKNPGIYEVEDLQISPNSEDIVICSWLISGNATQYVGNLNFMLSFKCVSDTGSVDYVWNTAINSSVLVVEAIINTDTIAFEYADIIAKWKAEIDATLEIGDLSQYAKTTEVNEMLEEKADLIDGKVPEEQLPDILSSWNDLKDKPTIPTKVSDLENDANYLTEHQDLSEYAKAAEIEEQIENKADLVEGKIPVEQIPDNVGGVQPDWNENDDTSKAYIKNKPFEDTAIVFNWDGNKNGLDAMFVQVSSDGYGFGVYKISNETISYEDLSGGTITVDGSTQEIVAIPMGNYITASATNEKLMKYFVVLKDGKLSFPNPNMTTTYATKGIYFAEGVTEIRSAKGSIKQIEEKFIPDTIARKNDIDEAIQSIDTAIASAIGSGVVE